MEMRQGHRTQTQTCPLTAPTLVVHDPPHEGRRLLGLRQILGRPERHARPGQPRDGQRRPAGQHLLVLRVCCVWGRSIGRLVNWSITHSAPPSFRTRCGRARPSRACMSAARPLAAASCHCGLAEDGSTSWSCDPGARWITFWPGNSPWGSAAGGTFPSGLFAGVLGDWVDLGWWRRPTTQAHAHRWAHPTPKSVQKSAASSSLQPPCCLSAAVTSSCVQT